MKAHHVEIVKKQLEGKDTLTLSSELFRSRQSFIEKYGCSSPYLPWESIDGRTQRESSSEKVDFALPVAGDLLRHIEDIDVLAVHYLVTGLTGGWQKCSGDSRGVAFEHLTQVTIRP